MKSRKLKRNPYKPATSYLDLAMQKQVGSAVPREKVRSKTRGTLTALPTRRPPCVFVSTPVTKAPPLVRAKRINRSWRSNYREVSQALSSARDSSYQLVKKYPSCPTTRRSFTRALPSRENSLRSQSQHNMGSSPSFSKMHPSVTPCRKTTLGSVNNPVASAELQSGSKQARANQRTERRIFNTSQFSTPISHVAHKYNGESRFSSRVTDLPEDNRFSKVDTPSSDVRPRGIGSLNRKANMSQIQGSNQGSIPLVGDHYSKRGYKYLDQNVKRGARQRKASFVRRRPTFNRRCRR